MQGNFVRAVNARNSAALYCLRMMRCADVKLANPNIFFSACQFYAIATLSWLSSNRIEVVEQGVLAACPRLTYLDLRNNPLQRMHQRLQSVQ
ncbi:hypothetical protein EVAR_87854_1 [Eumeta japonica]|uniref:Uncharacterized protein n=1 Tax=Eumeta variegata TaxID=151549 RepID=A0A4C1WVX7_EUMVA|nr:hypothetical protein EVAR_87854_1 [Eumeta japonica]